MNHLFGNTWCYLLNRKIITNIFLLSGINLSFMSIIAASLGFSAYLSENSKKYAPLSGVMQGFGELTGKCTTKKIKIQNQAICEIRTVY